MKTFIWNTEYDVYIVTCESIDKARSLLLLQTEKNYTEEMITLRLHKLKDPGYYNLWPNRYWEEELLHNRDEHQKAFLQNDPDSILIEYQAITYRHLND